VVRVSVLVKVLLEGGCDAECLPRNEKVVSQTFRQVAQPEARVGGGGSTCPRRFAGFNLLASVWQATPSR
jgi:hypothetical protein